MNNVIVRATHRLLPWVALGTLIAQPVAARTPAAPPPGSAATTTVAAPRQNPGLQSSTPDLLSALSAAATRPGDARARLALGHAYRDRGAVIEAWGAYRDVLAIAPAGSPERVAAQGALAALQRQAAAAHAAAGDDAGARRWLKMAQEMDGTAVAPVLPGAGPASAASLQRARVALAARQPAAALAALATPALPRSPEAIALRAEARLMAGDTVRAERDLKLARYLAPAEPQVRRVESLLLGARARALAGQGAAFEAFQLLGALDAAAAPADLVALRARLRIARSDTAGAIADLEAAVALRDATPLMHTDLARLYIANGQLAELALRYPQAAPTDSAAWLGEARRQQAAGRADAALAAWGRVVALDPANADAWGEAGRLRLASGDTARAIINLREAVKRGRGDLLPLFIDALALGGRGREAEQEIAKALQSPRRPPPAILETLALSATRHGLASAARQLAAVLRPAPAPTSAAAATTAPPAETRRAAASGAPPVPAVPAPAAPVNARATETRAPTPSKPTTSVPPWPTTGYALANRTAPATILAPSSPVVPMPSAPTSVAARSASRPESPAATSAAQAFSFSSPGPRSPSAEFPATHGARSGPEIIRDSQLRKLTDDHQSLIARGDSLGAARVLARMAAAGVEVSRRDLIAGAAAARKAGENAIVVTLMNALRNSGALTADDEEALGDALAAQGDVPGALEAWERAAVKPRTPLLLKIARAWQARGHGVNARRALESAEAAADSGDERRMVALARGQFLLDEGKAEEAASVLEALREANDECAAWYGLALAHSGRGALVRALNLRLDDLRVPAHVRAELAAARGDSIAALSLFDASPPPARSRAAWNTWIDLLAARASWPAAAAACLRLEALPGGAGPAALLRARLANRKGESSAASWARLALRLDPADPETRLEVATILWRAGRAGEAAACLAPLVVTLPDGLQRARALAASGTALLGLGLVDDAARQLSEAHAMATAHADQRLAQAVAYNLALAERRRGEPGRALSVLDNSGRDDLPARLIRASSLIDLEQMSEAIAILEAAASASPIATLNYGILLRLNGMPTDSVRVLRYLAEIWSGEALVHFHLATSLEAAGSLPAAREAFLVAAEKERDTDLAALFRRQAARLLTPDGEEGNRPPS